MKSSQEGKNEEMKKARMNRRIKEMKKPRIKDEWRNEVKMNEEAKKSRWIEEMKNEEGKNEELKKSRMKN